MQLQTIYFEFETPLHIGNVRADYDISESVFHSDALIAAIYQAWSMLGKSEFIPADGKPEFALSSLMPYTTVGKQKVHFFAKPFGRLNDITEEHKRAKAKDFKKLAYFDETFFDAFLNKTSVNIDKEALKGKYLTNNDIDNDFMKSDVYPRVRVPRDGEKDENEKATDTKIYYIERIYFKPQSGLYCIVQYDTDEQQQRVESALRLLGDEGIGTDRNIGNGKFRLHTGTLNLNIPNNSHYFTNLSLFVPESKAQLETLLTDSNCAYDIIRRGGWVTTYPYNTYRKNPITMFKEGCVFKFGNQPNSAKLMTAGETHNTTPKVVELQNGTVYRCGKSIFIPVNI